MNEENKKPIGYIIVLAIAVVAIVVIALLSDARMDKTANEYQTALNNQIKKTDEYYKENEQLKKENSALKSEGGEPSQTDEGYVRSMKKLSDIYLLIDDGDTEAASKELLKFKAETDAPEIESFKKALIKLLE